MLTDKDRGQLISLQNMIDSHITHLLKSTPRADNREALECLSTYGKQLDRLAYKIKCHYETARYSDSRSIESGWLEAINTKGKDQ